MPVNGGSRWFHTGVTGSDNFDSQIVELLASMCLSRLSGIGILMFNGELGKNYGGECDFFVERIMGDEPVQLDQMFGAP